MFYVFGTMRNGTVELDESVKWPDGTRVRVTVQTESAGASDPGDEPLSPEEIERIIRADAELPPPTPEEAAAAHAAVLEVIAYNRGRLVPTPLANGVHANAPVPQPKS